MTAKHYFIFCLIAFIPVSVFSQSIVINEFMAANHSFITDEDGDYSDWIEVFNSGSQTINLQNYTLSDDKRNPGQWMFPQISLSPGQYLLIWASGKDKIAAQLHTNFKLSSNGEYLGIYSPQGDVLDSLSFGSQRDDISMARLPNGSGDFSLTEQSTPGAANQFAGIIGASVIFSPESGFYSGPLTISLSTNISGAEIRYTLNGAAVTENSPLYANPIRIYTTRVLRARVFLNSQPVGEESSRIYQLDFNGHLPVLSLATDEENLFGDTGIFDNTTKRGDEWEKPVAINYIDRDGRSFQINAGMRVHGGLTRRRSYPKQSIRLYFRKKYGASKLKFKLFENKKIDHFDRLIVHSGGSSDQYYQPWAINKQWTLLRDPLNHILWQKEKGIISAARPVLLYINGNIWGIYNIRERVDDNYIQSNFHINNFDLLRADNDEIGVETGDLNAWNETYSFFENNHFSNPANYAMAQERVDIENFTDFNIFNIFIGNWDWPHNNIYFFREKSTYAKWKWIMWDTDVSLGSLGSALPPSMNTLEWATRSEPMPEFAGSGDKEEYLWSTLFLRKLLENEEYKNYFINRFADLMNTTLRPQNIQSVFDSLVAVINPDIQFEIDRWDDAKLQDWQHGVEVVKSWVQDRRHYQMQHIRDKFNLPANHKITLRIGSEKGTIRVNTKICTTDPWEGDYFQNVPITLEAIPAPGYQFSHWDYVNGATNRLLKINLTDDLEITAFFKPLGPYFKLIYPNGGELILSDHKIAIEWRSYWVGGNVHLDYSTNNGATWSRIASNQPNRGLYLWTTPDIQSDRCLIKISDTADNRLADQSDTCFSIGRPYLQVTSPNGGEHWVAETSRKITWDYRGFSDFVRLEYSGNNGNTWQLIDHSAGNTGEYSWQVPGINSDHCLIRISDLSDLTLTDRSDQPFSIAEFSEQMKIVINADDRYELWVNGTSLGGDSQWDSARTYLVPVLYGKNVIAVLGNNRGGDKGVIAEISVNDEVVFVSGNDWRYQNIEKQGWKEVDYNDSSWPLVDDFGRYGISPWGTKINGFPANSTAHWIWGTNSETYLRGSFDYSLQKQEEATDKNQTGMLNNYHLAQNYPNPFNPVTTIRYTLPQAEFVNITIYDVNGRTIRTLIDEMKETGTHSLIWAGNDRFGNHVSSGVYFYKMVTGSFVETKKMILME